VSNKQILLQACAITIIALLIAAAIVFTAKTEDILILCLLPLALAYCVFGLDDLFIDCVYWLKRPRITQISQEEIREMAAQPEKRIAIMVAAWHEYQVLRSMIVGNLKKIQYTRYDFFVGVYPNDKRTAAIARRLEKEFDSVHVVVNRLNGPSSKGQMLNEVIRGIFLYEQAHKTAFDGFLIHDAEDIIHPLSLKVINLELGEFDFIQMPIFSLPLKQSSLVGSIYMDEFAESHTKDILVRTFFGVSIPSAGVGTALSRNLIKQERRQKNGEIFNPRSVTEDYELGMSLDSAKIRSTFAPYQTSDGEFIATRELFPNAVLASVKQKSRWTLGICFQGLLNLGWKKSRAENYFLYRDRKSPVTNAIAMFGLGVVAYFLAASMVDPSVIGKIFAYYSSPYIFGLLTSLLTINLALMANRLAQRAICTHRIYGKKALPLLPVRYLVGNFINFFAALKATDQFIKNKVANTQPQWLKTVHELPVGFGEAGAV
jgi:adsorption protein B